METAFQPDAFQNNAFQIAVVTPSTGHAGRVRRSRVSDEGLVRAIPRRKPVPILGYGGVRFSAPRLDGTGDVNDDDLALEMILLA